MQKSIKILIIIAAVILTLATVPLLINVYVVVSTSNDIVEADNVELNKRYDCILVLGAGIQNNEAPSDMLRDRLDTAITLYNSGIGNSVLLSGDRSGDHYDEVAVMKSYCLEAGIPEEDIVCDNFGFSTYESIVNAMNEHDCKSMVVVTQRYHLHRSLYIAEQLGAKAVGVAADTHRYGGQFVRDVRECAARVKDFFAVNLMN